ncbi:disease resistance protein RUN1-like [Syzygium oleosum]|uniref:disease resistance protein RUN1-like n=1 Tax=Syzygium oleosum TaxID=219896 RepID=UPI0024BA35A5|nr:disease resistance protein RUN1-like [Syzygium oleosum]
MDKEQSQRKRAEEESIEGASTSSFISPVPTDVGSSQYDVFLSFRGSDTRKAFTDHLYHSLIEAATVPIYVFRDNNSIPIGEEFGSKILDAITRSKISIPIISENYASSKWCLRELIHIMDCKKSTSHIVLPIFYKVDPSDVRYLKGSFGEAFHSHKKHFDEKDIQEGQRALREVSDLHGWESEKVANGHEGELVEKVKKKVMSELRQDFQLDVSKHLVGIGDHVNKIRNWVDTPTTNARMIGIYGMGGIGKTTLAKVIYNWLSNDFVHRSFLADIRETACRNGIPYLQKQLIKEILRIEPEVWNVDDGINIIKSRFRGKKVLILLDDIDDKNQLDALAREHNWFMAGSMIIATTRNEAILDQSEFEVDYKYELNELDEVQALLLFNRHAFHTDHSPRDFEGISSDIISTMGGLPLALQVVGSYLYKKTNRKVWEDVRKQLKSQPHRDVQKILRISYDALEDGHKQIFLDIVCFFIGVDSEVHKLAMYMWEDRGFYPSQGIEELKLRCLIKIGDDGEFIVHDQLRDLGRNIFCQGQPFDKPSGPWDYNNRGASRVIWEYKRPFFSVCDWMRAASSGDSSNELLSEDLSWSDIKRRLQRICICRIFLCCILGDDPPLPTISLHLPNLSVLDLSWSRFTEDWEGWRSSFMASKRLHVLDLGWCEGLRCTPDLSAFTQLKVLCLRGCARLEHLHPSIGKLKSLVSLDLRLCHSLKELPEEVGELKDLEELVLDESRITEIPTSIGSLRKLKKLSAFCCKSLREIPSSIGNLHNLQHLNLFGCESLKELPEEVGELKDLEELVLAKSGITEIPTSIGSLTNLKELSFRCCRSLREIPSSIGDLQNLQLLDLYGCESLKGLPEEVGELKDLEELVLDESRITEIPTSIGSLRKLKKLSAFCCKSPREIPSSIGNLHNLQHLNLFGCESLKELPEEVGELKDLEELVLAKSGITEIPTSIGSLTNLKELSFRCCRSLREIPSSIGDLQNLQLLDLYGCESLKGLPEEVGELKDLEELLLDATSIAEIPTSIGSLRKLKKLSATYCHSLREIPSSIGDLQNLRALGLAGCYSLKGAIPSEIGDLFSLESLNFCDTLISDLPESIRNLSSLQSLRLSGCDKLRSLPELPSGLTDLWVSCQSPRLPHLSSLIHLEELHLSACLLLEDIPKLPSRLLKLCIEECGKLILLKLNGLKNLELFIIKKCSSIERLDLSQLIRLKNLHVKDCNNLVEIQGQENLEFLERIFIDDCNSIKRLLCPESRCLKRLVAVRCNNLVEIRGLDGAKFLEKLNFTGCESMEMLPNLTGCEKLRSLNVQNCKKLTQLGAFVKLDLIDLDISGCDSLEVIPKLSGIRVFRNYEGELSYDSCSDDYSTESD